MVSRSVTVTWLPPENVGSITDYEVKYFPVMGPCDITIVRVAGSALSTVAGGLSAFTEYGVAVRACSQVACGPFSSVIIQPTLEEG